MFLKWTVLFCVGGIALNTHAEDFTNVDKLISRYEVKAQRPPSCPLESKRLSDILVKMDAIKSTFKNNCLQKNNNEKLEDVLKSLNDVEDELNKRSSLEQDLGKALTDATTTVNNPSKAEINGLKLSTHFENINSLIRKKQCNLEDGRVLETTADLIYDSTQFGLISGSSLGIMVAGGGFVLSSALKLIDFILKQKFDFDKIQDRQTFIKLNCSFYDIRNALELDGVLEVENKTHREDLKMVNEYIESINSSLKKSEELKTNQLKHFANIDLDMIKRQVGDTASIKKALVRLKDIVTQARYEGLPDETKKMLSITDIIKEYDSLILQLEAYKKLNVSTIPMLDDAFVAELRTLNPANPSRISELIKMPVKEFNETIKPLYLYHIVRILADIEGKELPALEGTIEVKKAYLDYLDEEKNQFNRRLIKLNVIKAKLEKFVSGKPYSALDDGTDNLVGILEDYKVVSSMLYGELGDKFLRYTSTRSKEEMLSFNDRFSRFSAKYLENNDMDPADKAELTYICQDIQKLKLNFKYADSLTQEGYDFIVTNKDLFYGDVRNHYGQQIDETASNLFLGPIERIQRHYISTLLALKAIRGLDISVHEREKYLSPSYFSKSQFLGWSMIEVDKAKKSIAEMQAKFDSYDCQKVLREDFN